MKLVKYLDSDGQPRVGHIDSDRVVPLRTEAAERPTITELLDLDPKAWSLQVEEERGATHALADVTLLAPIDNQEVWGAGVTYMRSKVAREQESEGAALFYDLVYAADRPELFFKATPNRVAGPHAAIRVRRDSKWTVPEPELGLVLTSRLRLAGITLGNDVSARDIEGANPLYLPQAKVYNDCCALGPSVRRVDPAFDFAELTIHLDIRRAGRSVFQSEASFARMIRPLDQLIDYLGRDNGFPHGVVLLTGTGIVPPDDLSLAPDDLVEIHCDAIGTLSNYVVRSK